MTLVNPGSITRNRDDHADVVIPQRFRIKPKINNRFCTVMFEQQPNGEMKAVVGHPEIVAKTVTYTMRDRLTGTLAGLVREALVRRGDIPNRDNIMLFILPPNDRGADYVVYNDIFIEVLDA